MKTKRKIDYIFNLLSFDRRYSTKCSASNQTRQNLGPRPLFFFAFGYEVFG